MVGVLPFHIRYKDEYKMKSNNELEYLAKKHESGRVFRKVPRAINLFDQSREEYIATQEILSDRK